MMTIEDIKDRPEGLTFDCKSVKIEPKALAVPIVAMANADGGMLAIGIFDKTRRQATHKGNVTANGNVTVNVTVKNKSVTVKMPQKTKDVLYFLLKEPELSAELLAEKMDCSSRTIKRHLAVLTKSKILKRIGSDKSGSWALAL